MKQVSAMHGEVRRASCVHGTRLFCPATAYQALLVALIRPIAVTLKLKSGGKRGSTMPATFSSAADFASFAATRDICLVSKDGLKKKIVRSLSDAQSDVAGDYLLLTAPFDSLEEDVSILKRNGKRMSSGQEQATTLAIVTSPALRAEFGDLCAIADGHGIVFYDHEGNSTMEVDGLVKNSVVVLVNEAKNAPTVADVNEQRPRKALLELILSDPSKYTSSPSGCLEALAGITTVVPVLSGYHFLPEVETACKKAGVRVMKTNGSDYSHSTL